MQVWHSHACTWTDSDLTTVRALCDCLLVSDGEPEQRKTGITHL